MPARPIHLLIKSVRMKLIRHQGPKIYQINLLALHLSCATVFIDALYYLFFRMYPTCLP